MAINLTMAKGAPSSSTVGNQTMNFTVTVENTGASAVTLTALNIAPINPAQSMRIGQPNFITPNVAPGVGNPVIAAAGSASYGFQVVLNVPVLPGPSPQAPGGAAPSNAAARPYAPFTLRAQSQVSDGTISSGDLFVPVLSSEIPQDSGGALVLTQGFNIVNLLTL